MQLSVLGALGPGIPHIINTKLLKQFTCLTYNNGRSGTVSVERNADGGGGEVWGLRCNSMFRDPLPKSHCRLTVFWGHHTLSLLEVFICLWLRGTLQCWAYC